MSLPPTVIALAMPLANPPEATATRRGSAYPVVELQGGIAAAIRMGTGHHQLAVEQLYLSLVARQA